MGFVACVSDPCVFVRQNNNFIMSLHDFVSRRHAYWRYSGGSNQKVADDVSSHYRMKTLGKVRSYFATGLHDSWINKTLTIRYYIHCVSYTFLLGVIPVGTELRYR